MARYTTGGGGGGGSGAPAVAGAYYVGGLERIQGVAVTPGWNILTEFDLDATLPATAILDAIALVSDPALTCNIRLFKVTAPPGVVAGSVLTTASLTGARVASGDLVGAPLVAGARYQIQAECVGGALDSDFALVRYAVLT